MPWRMLLGLMWLGRNVVWVNSSGSGTETRVERYPCLLSVRAHRPGRLFIQSSRQKKGRHLLGILEIYEGTGAYSSVIKTRKGLRGAAYRVTACKKNGGIKIPIPFYYLPPTKTHSITAPAHNSLYRVIPLSSSPSSALDSPVSLRSSRDPPRASEQRWHRKYSIHHTTTTTVAAGRGSKSAVSTCTRRQD